jgi:hypothetical protein
MTQYPYDPNQPAPVPYAGGYAPAARPGSITTMAVFAIILGSLGTLCCGLTGVAGGLFNLAQGNQVRLPDGTMYQQNSGLALANVGIAGADLVTSVVLLVAGIGALSLKPWARRAAVTVSGVIIAVAIARLVVTFVWVIPETTRLMGKMQQGGRAQQQGMAGMMSMMGTGQKAITIVVFLITVGIAGSIIALWTKPAVKAWFEGGGAGVGGYGGYPQG